MSKIGRNDPCPCGSGKKYKHCCLGKDEEKLKYELELNKAYAIFYNINKLALNKSNKEEYSKATLYDAMSLTFTSNALSFIKALMEHNYINTVSLLNLRNMIECFSILMMHVNGDISKEKEELFVEQYKIIEYNLYKDMKDLGVLIDLDDLQKDYQDAKDKFLELGISTKQFKAIERTRVPFLCDKQMNFNKILEKHLPMMQQLYQLLSIIVHPSVNLFFIDKNYLNGHIKIFIELLYKYASKFNKGGSSTYYEMKNRIFAFNLDLPDNYAKQIMDCVKEQCNVLEHLVVKMDQIYKGIGYPSYFFRDIICIIKDLAFDMALGLCENVKLKAKVIFEKIAVFNEVYFYIGEHGFNYRYKMLSLHSIYEYNSITDDGKDEMVECVNKAFDLYKKEYASSLVNREVFEETFKKATGYLIDGQGQVPTLTALVKTYIDKYITMFGIDDKKSEAKQYMTALYLESQALSHSSGYLYFANTGAWSEDINVVNILDDMLLGVISKMKVFFAMADKDVDNNRIMKVELEKAEEKWKAAVKNKRKIFISVPRVSSSF